MSWKSNRNGSKIAIEMQIKVESSHIDNWRGMMGIDEEDGRKLNIDNALSNTIDHCDR